MMLNFWSEAGSIYLKFILYTNVQFQLIPEIEMNFDYVLCRKCMAEPVREAAGAALTLASAPAIMITERNERVKNLRMRKLCLRS